MSQVICPLCGKFFSVRYYEPEEFEDDIKRVQVRSLGRGKGIERAWTKSIFEDEDAPIFIKIRDRVAKLYSLFFDDEDRSDDREELLDDVNAALRPYYNHDFLNFDDAVKALLAQFQDYEEEDEEKDDDEDEEEEGEVDFESLSELDKEIYLFEREEAESEESEDEDDE